MPLLLAELNTAKSDPLMGDVVQQLEDVSTFLKENIDESRRDYAKFIGD